MKKKSETHTQVNFKDYIIRLRQRNENAFFKVKLIKLNHPI